MILEALEERVRVGATGAAVTVIDTDSSTGPPAPVHVMLYKVVAVGDTETEPLVALLVSVKLVATQEVAFVELHESVALSPEVRLEAVEVKERVGAGGGGAALTVIVTDLRAEPPVPVQVIL